MVYYAYCFCFMHRENTDFIHNQNFHYVCSSFPGMDMDAKKYISLLLFTCFSVFLGHNLIPHHHHSEAINLVEDHHDSDDHPKRCHAFNGIDFVKYNSTDVLQPVRIISTLTVPVSQLQLEPPFALEFQRFIFLKIPDKSTDYFGAISLRAPPPFSA